jgi:DNA-binding transcriptional ArsR family regulator
MNDIFKALNDVTRRVELLKSEDLSAGEIADHFNISKPSISHHLDILNKRFNHFRKKSQFIIYSVNTPWKTYCNG